MIAVTEATTSEVRCHKCGAMLGLRTPYSVISRHKGREWQIGPGSTATVKCVCGEVRAISVPLAS